MSGVQIPSDQPGYYAYNSYVVTALHVISSMQKLADKRVFLRVNTHDGGFDIVETNFEDWVRPDHSDGLVDAAVCFFPHNNRDHFDYDSIQESFAITPDQFEANSVGIGNDVYFAGLFVNHYGKRRNETLMRSGTLAAIPTEEVKTRAGNAPVYLVEARSIGGLSGSPVLVEPVTNFMAPDAFEIRAPGNGWYLLGLMQGHWETEIAVGTDTDEKSNNSAGGESDEIDKEALERLEAVNMGIAMVTPIERILPLLRECAAKHVNS